MNQTALNDGWAEASRHEHELPAKQRLLPPSPASVCVWGKFFIVSYFILPISYFILELGLKDGAQRFGAAGQGELEFDHRRAAGRRMLDP